MRILLTVHQFLPDYFSGTEILTLQTAQEFRRRGHDVAVFTGFPVRTALDDAARFDSYEYEGIPVERFSHSSVPMGGQSNIQEAEYNNLLVSKYFRRYVTNLKPDMVHFFHLGRLSASAIDVCREIGIPMVLTATDFWFVCPMNQLRLQDDSPCAGPDNDGANCFRHMVYLTQPSRVSAVVQMLPNWFLAWMLKIINMELVPKVRVIPYIQALAKRPAFLMERMNFLDKVLVATHLMARILQDNGLDPQKLAFRPFGINLSNISHQVREARTGPLQVGFIGTITGHKGAHVLVQALRSIPPHESVVLRIYGGMHDFPSYAEELRQMASDDPRIKFPGTFPNDRISEVLASLDVLVVPSLWYENTPLVIHSAQAAGCPVIASNVEGLAEVIHHGDNGLLFEPGNVSELAAQIRMILHDKELLPKLSARARKPKSSSDYAAELLAIYSEILAGRKRPIYGS